MKSQCQKTEKKEIGETCEKKIRWTEREFERQTELITRKGKIHTDIGVVSEVERGRRRSSCPTISTITSRTTIVGPTDTSFVSVLLQRNTVTDNKHYKKQTST